MADRRRAVVLANRLPYPLDDGWKVRTFHVIREVAARLDTTLIVFHPADGADAVRAYRAATGGTLDVVTVPPTQPYTPLRLILGLVTRTPVHAWNMRSPEFDRALSAVLAARHHDVGIAVYALMFPYFERIPVRLRTIIDTHNIDSALMRRYLPHIASRARRLYARVTARNLEHLEDSVMPRADVVWVCSDDERRQLAARNPATRVEVIPNGVDTEAMMPRGTVRPAAGRLLFFGKLNYFPNTDGLRFFLSGVLPLIRREEAGAELHVVGRGAEGEVTELCRGVPGVTLVGAVDDVRPALYAAEVVVVPLRVGGGTRLKILEGLAAGRAVVSTTIGAEGLDLRAGEEILIADSAADFASSVLQLLRDADLRVRIGTAGQRAVREKYDWRAIGDQLSATLLA